VRPLLCRNRRVAKPGGVAAHHHFNPIQPAVNPSRPVANALVNRGVVFVEKPKHAWRAMTMVLHLRRDAKRGGA
jgi:hypothetical protein